MVLHPFPSLGNYDSDGIHLTVQEELDNGLKKKDYQALCKKYSLPNSGTITVLKDRLIRFSKDKNSWAALIPGTTLSHLGPRQGSKTKKMSTKRWEAKSVNDSTLSLAVTSTSYKAKGMNPLIWAAQVFQSKPSASIQSGAASPYVGSIPHPVLQPTILAVSTSAVQDIGGANNSENNSQFPVLVSELPNNVLRSFTNPMHGDTKTQSFPHPSSFAPSASTFSAPGISSEFSATTRCLVLKGKRLTVTESQVPDPPGFNSELRGPMDQVMNNIMSWWDDRLPEWDPSRALLKLTIDGEKVGIPGVLWKELYAAPWKKQQWNGLRHRYSEITVLLRYYQSLGPEERASFWDLLSIIENGVHKFLSYTKAMKIIRRRRQQIEQEQAAELITDPEFAERFCYNRGGKVVTLKKASAIVKRASRSTVA
ncbi:hypothetical protein R3P38DRAFT_3214160 [Favolaschia claudopus]|uniref:SAP domain-containing protein n=1 Tax=Favolaschia claudopus TaxID=2862362 RepID=A0AAW0AAT3_9AGAR